MMLFSILIPTLASRDQQFAALHAKLCQQIAENGLSGTVEILHLRDNGEVPTGTKRNQLLRLARGEFVAFVDDDDEVSSDYISRICGALSDAPEVHCVGIRGIITFRGGHPRGFVHSLRYRDYFSHGHTYFRPPYHLNPIRRSIASRYSFRDVSYSEDIDWALRMQRDRALESEVFVDAPVYYYRSRRWWPYQWLLDQTEALRHTLGLRMVNRLRLGRV